MPASLEEMKSLGYGPKKSSAETIMNTVNAARDTVEKRDAKQKNDLMDQVKLYGDLRNAGYSPEDAHARVTRTYRSTAFIERIVNGEADNAFQKPPAGADKQSLETQKTKAEIGKIKAETRATVSKGRYYDKGGARGLGNKDQWTPNQWQGYIDFLTNEDRNPDFGTPDNDEEVSFAREKLRASAGFTPDKAGEADPGTVEAPAAAKKPAAGAPPAASTAGRVAMTKPDGSKVLVAQKDVQKALAKGYRKGHA